MKETPISKEILLIVAERFGYTDNTIKRWRETSMSPNVQRMCQRIHELENRKG